MVIKVLKKKTLIFIFCICIALFFLIKLCGCFAEETVATFPLKDRTVVIDAGHGGVDGGAAANGGLEKSINLSIATYLKSYLKQSGARVIMTRESDKTLGENESTLKAKKTADLNKRKSIVNNIAPDVFVSIHQNFFSESKYKGAQTFYESKNVNSVKLAEIVQQSLVNNLDKSNKRVCAEIPKEKLLFRDLKVPSILVECGFLSNREEAELLKTKEYQQKIAYAIFLGISQYFCQ